MNTPTFDDCVVVCKLKSTNRKKHHLPCSIVLELLLITCKNRRRCYFSVAWLMHVIADVVSMVSRNTCLNSRQMV